MSHSPPISLVPDDLPSFVRLAEFVTARTGIFLGAEKATFMNARLRKRFRETGCDGVKSYLHLILTDREEREIPHLISALTTNVTEFFRESAHFEILTKSAIPEMKSSGKKHLNIWSAGCSTGQEPISISLSILDLPIRDTVTAKIYASDIDGSIIAKAKEFRYPAEDMKAIPRRLLDAYFTRIGSNFVAKPQLREMIDYSLMNLNDSWAIPAKMDAIFCRNVAIHFDEATQKRLWQRLSEKLSSNGWLFVGHAERITGAEKMGLELFESTVYRKSRKGPMP